MSVRNTFGKRFLSDGNPGFFSKGEKESGPADEATLLAERFGRVLGGSRGLDAQGIVRGEEAEDAADAAAHGFDVDMVARTPLCTPCRLSCKTFHYTASGDRTCM